MKKFRNLFKRQAKGGIIDFVMGISASDWCCIYNDIKAEYDKTATAHKKPTEYMRGLAYALEVMDTTQPYNIMEVK